MCLSSMPFWAVVDSLQQALLAVYDGSSLAPLLNPILAVPLLAARLVRSFLSLLAFPFLVLIVFLLSLAGIGAGQHFLQNAGESILAARLAQAHVGDVDEQCESVNGVARTITTSHRSTFLRNAGTAVLVSFVVACVVAVRYPVVWHQLAAAPWAVSQLWKHSRGSELSRGVELNQNEEVASLGSHTPQSPGGIELKAHGGDPSQLSPALPHTGLQRALQSWELRVLVGIVTLLLLRTIIVNVVHYCQLAVPRGVWTLLCATPPRKKRSEVAASGEAHASQSNGTVSTTERASGSTPPRMSSAEVVADINAMVATYYERDPRVQTTPASVARLRASEQGGAGQTPESSHSLPTFMRYTQPLASKNTTSNVHASQAGMLRPEDDTSSLPAHLPSYNTLPPGEALDRSARLHFASPNTLPTYGASTPRRGGGGTIDSESIFSDASGRSVYVAEVARARKRAVEARRAARTQARGALLQEIAEATGVSMDSTLLQDVKASILG